MRLLQHINEAEPWDGISDRQITPRMATFVLFMTNILRDCRPFLRDLDSHYPKFMYSGRKRDTDWFEQSVRSDRQPKDLSKDIHTDFDNEFNKQFGWRPRSNGLFCTGDESSAFEYGNTFMIFPKGQYKILWSYEISDLYIYIQRTSKATSTSREGNVLYQYIYDRLAKDVFLSNKMNNTNDVPDISKVTREYHQFVTDTVKKYEKTGIREAIDSHKEIMVSCQTYYAVRYKYWHIAIVEFFRKFGNDMPDTDILHKWLSDNSDKALK